MLLVHTARKTETEYDYLETQQFDTAVLFLLDKSLCFVWFYFFNLIYLLSWHFSKILQQTEKFTEIFFYQLNFKLNISLLEDAKFPQRDLVVTYETVPAARMMCGVIL